LTWNHGLTDREDNGPVAQGEPLLVMVGQKLHFIMLTENVAKRWYYSAA